MKFIDESKQYQRLFHFEGIDFLMSDAWMGFYKGFYALETAIDDSWYCWLPKKVLEAQLDDGAEFFADTKRFNEYFNAHVEYLNKLLEIFDSEIKKPEILTKQNVEKFLGHWCLATSFFYRTEFFYTDKAYKLSVNNPVMQENLMRNYKLKERSRVEIFNYPWFGEDSYFRQMSRKLEKQFGVSIHDLKYYGVNDIYKLFYGVKVDSQVTRDRKEARVIIGEGNTVTVHAGAQVKDDILTLLKQAGEEIPSEIQILKGIPASKGKVIGRVKVIVSDPKTFDSLAKEFERMEKGDILVAETTSPEFMPACEKASAILANQGGLLSHAAVVSREFGIPCVVALKYATHVLKDGYIVEVDGEKGTVKILERK